MTKARDLANAGTALTTVSPTELEYLDGVTSPIQTQVDAKTAKSTLTTAGDIYYASSADTPARLGIGTAAQVLTVNSGAIAPEWATPGGSGANWSLLNAGGTLLTGATTITVSGISGADKIMVITENASSSADASLKIIFNGVTTSSNYKTYGAKLLFSPTYTPSNLIYRAGNQAGINIGDTSSNELSQQAGYVLVSGCNSSGLKMFNSIGATSTEGGVSQCHYYLGGWYNDTNTISSVGITTTGGNFDAGRIYIYTSA